MTIEIKRNVEEIVLEIAGFSIWRRKKGKVQVLL